MNRYTLYCTTEQTKKALELGAPIIKIPTGGRENVPCYFTKQQNEEGWYECDAYYIPTADQMIGWLEEQGLFISILYGYEVSNKWAVDIDSEEYIDYKSGEFNSRKEATLASIDAALEYLSNNKN